MTTSEKKVFRRALAAGTTVGLVIGSLIALFIAVKPEFFARLIQ